MVYQCQRCRVYDDYGVRGHFTMQDLQPPVSLAELERIGER